MIKQNVVNLKRRQQGLSLVGLVLSLGILVVLAMVAMKVVPTVIEYSSIKKAIVTAKNGASTPREVQVAFDKQAEVGYITSIAGKDLQFTKGDDGMEVSFSYQKKIPLVGPASLLLEYEGTTARSGVVAKKPE